MDDDLVPVLVETRNSSELTNAVARMNGQTITVAPTVVAVRVARSKLQELGTLGAVDYVEANVRLDYSCDLAHRSARLIVNNKPTVSQTGRGVLVGVIDTGIDATHAAFCNGATSRIVDYLDQETGQRYDQAAIDAGAAAASPDAIGHGTHVAGIAAGNGGGSPDRRWRGVAPDADLAIVKTTMDSVDIATGVAHIFGVAEERRQPCVINLSLGGHSGGHDGSTVVERVIDELSGPGRIVAVAAGNEGSAPLHAGIDLDPDRSAPARWVADFVIDPQMMGGQLLGILVVQVWHQREDLLKVQLRSPTGETFSTRMESTAEFNRGSLFVKVSHRRAGYSGDHVTTFQVITLPQASLQAGWSVIVQEATHGDAPVGAIHAWIQNRSMGHFTQGSTRSYLVGVPGTAFSAITVASYATRREWPGELGPRQPNLSAMKLEDISYFSSSGPTRDRHNKPEIAAPGQWLVAPLSSAALEAHVPRWTRVRNRPYAAMQGTSMATPYVTGAIALVLEKEPGLDWAEIKRRIIKSARQDGFTGPSWNSRWGYGKLDVEGLLTVESGP